MEQISPIQALLQQRTLLQLEYYTEKEAFRKLTEQMGMQRKVKRGDAWFPLRVGKSFYNSLNQTAIEVFRTSDQDIEHNFEFGRPVMFFMVKKMGKNENQGSTALQQSENPSDANHKVQSSNLKVQSKEVQSIVDFRDAIRPKKPLPDAEFAPKRYYQVYEQKYGFQPNMSILDLLFNEGNEAIFYL